MTSYTIFILESGILIEHTFLVYSHSLSLLADKRLKSWVSGQATEENKINTMNTKMRRRRKKQVYVLVFDK